MRTGTVILTAIILYCTMTGGLYAYTYSYTNTTGYVVRVTVRLYDDADKTNEMKANASYAVLTDSLLKSWTAEVFFDGRWQQVLNLTCDFLPGNHTFIIQVEEKKNSSGPADHNWYAVTDPGAQKGK